MSFKASGQTNPELSNFLRSNDNKDQLLNINEGGNNIKEIYLLNKSNSSLVSSITDKFFDRINDERGINHKKPQIEPFKLKNNDSSITVPSPVGLIVYLTKSQLDELNKDSTIKSILDDAGRIEIEPSLSDRDKKIIKNIKYETIGQVYNGDKFKTDSFKIKDKDSLDIL